MRIKFYTEEGQAALVIVLVSIIILTIGIAAAAHTTSDLRMTSQLEESVAALAAAEAGLELALLNGTSGTWREPPVPPYIAGATYTVTQIPDVPAETVYSLGAISLGDVRTIWMVDNPADPLSGTSYIGDILVEWDPNTAEVEFIAYYLEAGEILVRRWYVSAGDTVGINSADPPLADNWILLRVRPIKENLTNVNVSNYNASFPSQGQYIESIGQTASGITRTLSSTRWHDNIPSVLDYVLYSGSGLSK
jgi:hypothetical protein